MSAINQIVFKQPVILRESVAAKNLELLFERFRVAFPLHRPVNIFIKAISAALNRLNQRGILQLNLFKQIRRSNVDITINIYALIVFWKNLVSQNFVITIVTGVIQF